MAILLVIIATGLFYYLLPTLLMPSVHPWAEVGKKPRRVLAEWKRDICDYFGWKYKEGFTLVELAIVIVIIGFVVAGVLVGQSMIKSATLQAQITQIEKLNTAANAFRAKCGYLPGDITAQAAAACGLAPRGSNPGEGDGDGILTASTGGQLCASCETHGELAMFWVDLSTTGLIDGTFNTAAATCCAQVTDVTLNSSPSINAFLPTAKIGQGNYVYVAAGQVWNGSTNVFNGINYFGIAPITDLFGWQGEAAPGGGMTVAQAHAIDVKIDDGIPNSGRVLAYSIWYGGGISLSGLAINEQSSDSTTSCWNDHTNTYSTQINGGAGMNCNLAFQFQ
jgi:prepilin-type N-terminal cleavage/methylation domain-containing protein